MPVIDYEAKTGTTRVLMFTVRGEPCGQPRPRFIGGRAVSTLRGSKAALWRDAVKLACKSVAHYGQLLAATSLDVEMTFLFRRSDKPGQGSGEPHTKKPDADNLAKLVLDVMVDECLIEDDKHVAKMTVHKLWAPGQGVSVKVQPATPLAPVATHLDTEGLGSGGKPEWLN